MSNLDAKIAELKGYVVLGMASTDPLWEPDPKKYNLALKRLSDGEVKIQEHWSTSDAKAFELVDELAKIDPEMIFVLERNADNWWRAAFRDSVWIARHSPTRPEAVCRAYIAVREWMAGKEKRG